MLAPITVTLKAGCCWHTMGLKIIGYTGSGSDREIARMSKTCLLLILLLGLATGCSTLQIQTDYDPEVNFSTLRTYAWLERPPAADGDPRVDDNPLLHQRIHTAIDAGLQTAGYTMAGPAEADFLISYYITIDDMTSVTYINNYWGYGPGWGSRYHHTRPGFYPVYSQPVVFEYEQGTLVLDIIQPEGRKLVWRGVASRELDYSASPEARQERLDKTIDAILANFPPQ